MTRHDSQGCAGPPTSQAGVSSRARGAGARAVLVALLLAPGPAAAESLAVLAAADAPAGPGAGLAEATHRLRAALRARAGGVLDAAETRSRLLAPGPGIGRAEAERAYLAALSAYREGSYQAAIRGFRALASELERGAESPESYAEWIRAMLRLAHAEATIGHFAESRTAMEAVLVLEPRLQPDPEQFSPSYRRAFEQARARVAALPRRTLAVTASGRPGTAWVNGRPCGTTPATVTLPAGRYRVGGLAGAARTPRLTVDLDAGDRVVVLDFALAEALRPDAGPGLALDGHRRAAGAVAAGGWLGVERVVEVSAEAGGVALRAALYDVRSGALLRQARVAAAGGEATEPALAALAAFLLGGLPSEPLLDSEPPPPGAPAASPVRPALDASPRLASAGLAVPGRPAEGEPAPPAGPPAWLRPAAWVAGAASLVLAGFATYEAVSASSSYREAQAMLRPDGSLQPAIPPSRYEEVTSAGDRARTWAYVGAGAAVALAATAGLLFYLSAEPARDSAPGLAFRF